MSLLIYCLFAQSLRYAEKTILGISTICLWLFFQHASTLNENSSKSTDSSVALIFFLLLLPAMYPSSIAAATKQQTTISIDIQPTAKTTLFQTVAIVPFIGNHPALEELRSFFHTQLDQTNKYSLMPVSQTDLLLAKAKKTPDATIQPSPLAAVAQGKQLQSRGIITGTISRILASSTTTISDNDHFQMLITLWDIQTAQPVWNITIDIPHTVDISLPALDSFTDALQQATRLVVDRLVKAGAIYTPRIPAPTILSRQGDIRKIRVVVQPAPQAVHVSYQLLRAQTATAIFHPIGQPRFNNTTPLIVEDENLEDATIYWYTVIGYNADGLASIPDQPFSITTRDKPLSVPKVKVTEQSLDH